jgi:hypothetical protein
MKNRPPDKRKAAPAGGPRKEHQQQYPKNTTSRTWSATLNLANGALILTVTETPDRVFASLSGTAPRVEEVPKLERWLFSLLLPYEHDARPMEISGRHSTGFVFGAGSKAFGVLVPNAELAEIAGGRA